MGAVPTVQSPLSDEDLAGDWVVLMTDMFDGECPPTEDARGRGLSRGLAELWFRHLFESVDEHGRSLPTRSFHLTWRGGLVHVEGYRQYPTETVKKLRAWVQGPSKVAGLLEKLAEAHARLIQNRVPVPVDLVMNAVAGAADGADLITRLAAAK